MPQVNNPNAFANSLPGLQQQLRQQLRDLKGASRNNPFSLVVGLGGAIINGAAQFVGATVFNGVAQFVGGILGPLTVNGTFGATGSVSSGTSVIAGSDVSAGSNVNAGNNVNAPNGTLVSAYARAHQVSINYVAAYIDGSGNFLSTASGARYKRDVVTATWTREQRDKIRVVFYQLRAAYIITEMQGGDPTDLQRLVGVIGEELLEAGFPELVVLDDKARVFTVRYELIALIAVDGLQQAEARIDELQERLDRAGL